MVILYIFMYVLQEERYNYVYLLDNFISFKDIFIYQTDNVCLNLDRIKLIRYSVELKDLIRTAHSLVEAREKKRVTQEEMANRIGVSYRTYLEYQRGTNAPLAMKALLNLLSILDDQEIVRVVREWR